MKNLGLPADKQGWTQWKKRQEHKLESPVKLISRSTGVFSSQFILQQCAYKGNFIHSNHKLRRNVPPFSIFLINALTHNQWERASSCDLIDWICPMNLKSSSNLGVTLLQAIKYSPDENVWPFQLTWQAPRRSPTPISTSHSGYQHSSRSPWSWLPSLSSFWRKDRWQISYWSCKVHTDQKLFNYWLRSGVTKS